MTPHVVDTEPAITEAQLKDALDFSDDSWTDRDWETRTHQHYGASPYWVVPDKLGRVLRRDLPAWREVLDRRQSELLGALARWPPKPAKVLGAF